MSTYQRARKLQPFKINKEKTYLCTSHSVHPVEGLKDNLRTDIVAIEIPGAVFASAINPRKR